MTIQLSPDTRAWLQRYIDGQVSNDELAEWLVQVEYDLDLQSEERDALGQIRLAVIEVSEGLRPNEDILESVAAALALSRAEQVVSVRANSSTDWRDTTVVTTASSRPQHVDISI